VIQEFKDFISKGGILEAAVGLILALAFVPVVGELVDKVLMPIIAAIVGEPDFNTIGFDLGDARIGIGYVITALVNFIAIAAVIFFMLKAYNRNKEAEEDGPSEVDLLTQIRDSLAK
jgi:large conductance mechanosensitive channel